LRIVAGRWAGRDLVSPSGRIRPTAEAVRIACMEAVAAELTGARVLDLFAGTGALGLEALSRGADRCDFVENHPATLHALKANVATLRLKARTRIFKRDAIPFVERLERDAYDVAFADPPYGSRKLDRVLARWLERPFSRVLVLEHAADHDIALAGRRTRIRQTSRRLEDTLVTVLRLP